MLIESIEEFDRNGYIVLKNYFSEEEKTHIIDSAKRLYNLPEVEGSYMKYYENKEYLESKDTKRLLSRIEKFYKTDPKLEAIVEKINSSVNILLGEKMTLFKDKINWKMPGGGAFRPHQDYDAWTDLPPTYFLTCACFVDASTVKNGCLEMVKGKHREGLFKNTHGVIDEDVESGFNWEPLLITPYDLAIFDAWVPHRSDTNKSYKPRRAYFFTFNKSSDGDHYDAYFEKKRQELPPDFERKEGAQYNLNSKYNLANPIS